MMAVLGSSDVGSADDAHRPVVVAMAVVRMMKMVTHEVIDVVAVGYAIVSARSSVLVADLVFCAGVVRSAGIRIAFGRLEAMFVDVILMGMVEMAVVQIVHVAVVVDRDMCAIRTVLVGMGPMRGVTRLARLAGFRHGNKPPP